MATVVDTEFLKVTVDDQGVVWCLSGDQMPRCSGLRVPQFLESSVLGPDVSVRMVGSAANAELLIDLFERKLRGGLHGLQVCSPLCCESAAERKDPELLLYSMRSFGLPPSLGGWHEFDIKDYYSYALASHFHRALAAGEYTRKLLGGHPVWPALSFIAGLDIDACARLLATVIDPRWYIDASGDPNRGSKLEQYLGLNPKTQANLDRGNSPQQSRCRLVLACWKTEDPKKPIGPRFFLWRAWAARGGGTKGDLVASKLFIAYLRQVWAQAVCNGPQASRLFVPEHFFVNADEVMAYREHMARVKRED